MAVDGGDRVLFPQVLHQLEEGETLGFGAGVGRATGGIKAAGIGYADAVGVVAGAMGSDLLDGAARMDAAIRVDDIVIAAVGIGAGGGAVDDDFGDCSHFFVGLMGLMGLMGVFGLRRCRSIRNNRMDRGDRYDRFLERGLGWILAPALSGLVRD